MTSNDTVLRLRALCAPTLLLWLFGLAILMQLAEPSVASVARATKSTRQDANYRSYHFVLLVKSEGSNRTGASTDVSEELVIMPTDANLLERSTGGAIELKPQPLPEHITSALLKKYQTNRSPPKRLQTTPAVDAGTSVSHLVSKLQQPSAQPSIELHTISRGTGKKQRYPKKASAVNATPTTTERTAGTTAILKSSLRLLPVDDRDDGLAPFEVVATSKGSLPAQPRTVRKTAPQPSGDGTQKKARYEVIGTFRDAHVSRTRTQRLSAATR
uniref:DUF4758 domain-containing protein n=1 Tax=Anopheles atroparvus TaxID=41427 RepID=A0A182J5Y1_ANOAO